MRLLAFAVLSLVISACGVKAPPIAPEQKPEDTRVLNCSPEDPKCDVKDPKYKPRKH
ncbi:MAG: hypothetical protein ACXVBE_15520 [Bdellovibrionota bacterium]